MRLWGESIDASKAQLFPMPTEFDDLHDEDDDQVATTIPAIVSTASISVASSTTLAPNPTDHIDRPVNSKPANEGIAVSTTAPVSTTAATGTATSTASSSESPASDSFLSYFPNFGVSARTQIWIYGAIAAILIFCIALGIFCCVWRKRRTRSKMGDYEFEMVNDDDVDGAGEPLNGEGGRRKRRGGELYDAFAGESDEEIFSDAEEEGYRDEPSQEKKKAGDSSPTELSEKQ